MIYDVDINGKVRRVDIFTREGGFVVTVDGMSQAVDVSIVNGIWSLILSPTVDGTPAPRRTHEVFIAEQGSTGELIVHVDGRIIPATVASARAGRRRRLNAEAHGSGPQRIKAPMPGKVIKVLVTPGDTVTAGQGVIVVEAMKMENELRAARDGTVSEVRGREGDSVEAGAVLVVID